jgi:hypothetical protein
MLGITRSSRCWRITRWVGLAASAPALWACTSRSLEAPNITPTATIQTNFTQKINNEIDILFMIDNSSSMTEMQQKILEQLPLFMNVLTSLKNPPSLHVAVVSEDMGAPGDSTSSIGCTTYGDQGQFQSAPRSDSTLNPPVTCTNSTLATPTGQSDNNHTFLIYDPSTNTQNFTDPIATVFQCIALLGDKGCGFEHQLASIDRALGADGSPPPSTNAGFLRPEAYLGIVMLTNEDDCSAPGNTTIFGLNGYQQNISNPDGPIANYRCNGGPRGAHYCQDPANGNQWTIPPLLPPADAQGTATAPTLNLANCEDNEQPPMGTGSSALTPVSQFISDIKSLKPDPDNQILVAGIIAPATPYTVAWVPESGGQNTKAGELWPEVMHSCGAKGGDDVNPASMMSPTDGSFGDPGVRETQFLNAFSNSVIASICDTSYAASMQAIATKLGQLITPPCINGKIQNDANGNPECSVIEHLVDTSGNKSDRAIQSCAQTNNAPPCWTLAAGQMGCSGSQLTITDEAGVSTNSESSTINCSLCLPGSTQPGC